MHVQQKTSRKKTTIIFHLRQRNFLSRSLRVSNPIWFLSFLLSLFKDVLDCFHNPLHIFYYIYFSRRNKKTRNEIVLLSTSSDEIENFPRIPERFDIFFLLGQEKQTTIFFLIEKTANGFSSEQMINDTISKKIQID